MNRISAKIVADSISSTGKRITTMELIFPRFILAEFNTHRALSRNSASSRAIPFKKMVKMVEETPFIPIAWQKDHSGMQGTEYFDMYEVANAELNDQWLRGMEDAVNAARSLNESNLTKQLCNRLLEPFMYHKVLVTATEWDNFFNLRCPQYELFSENMPMQFKSKREFNKYVEMVGDGPYNLSELDWLKINKGMGEIHIMDLAEKMFDELNTSQPNLLKEGEWHIPYGDNLDLQEIRKIVKEEDLFDAKLKIATARCARLSYQTLGDDPKIDYEADLKLFDILFKSGHYSPFEHVSQCKNNNERYANFVGFKQLRTILEEQI